MLGFSDEVPVVVEEVAGFGGRPRLVFEGGDVLGDAAVAVVVGVGDLEIWGIGDLGM